MHVSTRAVDYTDLIRCLSAWHLTQCNSVSSHSSELELEGELDGAGAADLVEEAETAIGTARAEAARARLRRVAEEWLLSRLVGLTKLS